jgi:putative acetyltransferase
MTVTVRPETSSDAAAVRRVNELAFGGAEEADLVEALRRANAVTVALVAEAGGEVVGHIMFSAVAIEHPPAQPVAGLAPMAVLPDHQRSGIGGQLIVSGLAALREAGFGSVVVLGHPTYYPRFGFTPAGVFGLRCEYDVPSDVFMARELTVGGLGGASGLVRYHSAFPRG